MFETVISADTRSREKTVAQVHQALRHLAGGKAYRVTVKEITGSRTQRQNRYLWRIYEIIIEQAGLEGWEKDDLHEYFLGEHFGWETLEGMGRKRVKPQRRSSVLSASEFAAYVEFIQRTCAQKFGIVVPDPEPI